jgi:hypothetical protein
MNPRRTLLAVPSRIITPAVASACVFRCDSTRAVMVQLVELLIGQ